MGHSSTTNYSITPISYIEDSGDSVAAGSVANNVILTITPDNGYTVSAADFSISGGTPGASYTSPYSAIYAQGDPGVTLPPEVSHVSFQDLPGGPGPGQPGNVVQVQVTLGSWFTMPASNLEIAVDIDGHAVARTSPINDVSMCITDKTQAEGYCPQSYWPASISTASASAISTGGTYAGTGCVTQFINNEEESGVTVTTLTNDTNWTNPLTNISNNYSHLVTDTAEVTQYSTTSAPNITTTLFTKTFWTAPGYSFEVTPIYELNTAASNSGYYIIEETPTNFNVDKTVTTTVTSSNAIHCDTTDVIPGMFVTGSSLTSCADSQYLLTSTICYPWFFQDIRVVSVDHANSIVYITENNDFTANDVINFSTIVDIPATSSSGTVYVQRCCAKQFTVKVNASASTSCSDDHVINFAGLANVTPFVLGRSGSDPSPKITKIDLKTSNLSPFGEDRLLTIEGSNNSVNFDISLINNSGEAYNFETKKFVAGGNPILTGQSVDSTTFIYTNNIKFPETGTNDKVYTLNVYGGKTGVNTNIDTSTTFDTGVESTKTIKGFSDKKTRITSNAGSSGITIASSLTNQTIMDVESESETEFSVSVTGAITKGSSEIIYYNDELTSATPTEEGKFTNATANGMTANLEGTFTGSGSSSITATITGTITKSPTAATDITVEYGDVISTTPNAYDSVFYISKSALLEATDTAAKLWVHRHVVTSASTKVPVVSGGIDRSTADEDGTFVAGSTLPAVHKDFETVDVSTLAFGTVGSNGTDYNDGYFFGNSSGTEGSSTQVDQIYYKLSSADTGALIEPGKTIETFTYRNRDGTSASATKTATINFID
tara:strand:- start:999 stop:3500 length:2502 start_codon:yes stop_codon:yes gene_type:complete